MTFSTLSHLRCAMLRGSVLILQIVTSLYWGRICALESSHFHGAEALSHRLQELKQDLSLPAGHQTKLLEAVMKTQEDIVESFVAVEYRIQDLIAGREYASDVGRAPPQPTWSFESAVNDITRPPEIPIRVEVVFIGFSSSVVDVIDDHWLQKLNRTVHIPWARQHESSGRKAPALRYAFNVVQVSIHVEEAVRTLLASRLRPSSTPGQYYINALEVEPHLADLLSALKQSEPDSIPPAVTIFVVNTPLKNAKGEEVTDYAYTSGFSDDDLLLLAGHSAVRKAAESVVQRAKAKMLSKVDLEASRPSLSDTFPLSSSSRMSNVAQETISSLNGSSLGVQRDAIIASRTWAMAAQKRAQAQPTSLEERILALLSAKTADGSAASAHQVAMAKAVLGAAEAARNANDFETLCSFHSWFSDHRMAWVDLRSSQNPTVEAAHRYVPARNKNLALSEKLSSDLTDALEGRASATNRDHITLLESRMAGLLHQTRCKNEVGAEDYAFPQGDEVEWFHRLEDMNLMVIRGFFRGYFSQSCADLLIRHNFLSAFVATEYRLDQEINEILETGISQDSYVYTELKKFRNKLEREVIRLGSVDDQSGGFWEAISADFSDISALNRFIGSIAHHVVELTEQATITTRGEEALDVSSTLSDAEIDFLFAEEFVEDGSGESRALSFHQYLELHMPDYSRTARNKALHHSLSSPRTVSTNGSAASQKSTSSSSSLFGSGVIFPGKVDITVYVIPLHDTYKPAGDNGIDMTTLLTELQALRLPNQRLQVSAQTLSIKSQQDVARGLVACRRMHREGSLSDGEALPSGFYLDAECMWSHIRHDDDAEAAAAGDLHMPIFVFSTDSELPLYMGSEGRVAVSVGSGVMVVQNQQKHVPSNYFCGGKDITFNGRNPLSQILEEVANALIGASSANDKHYQLFGSSMSEFSGRSPLISGSLYASPSFGESDLDNALRAKVLQSVEVSRWLLEQKYAAARALLCGLRGRRCLETWGLSYAVPIRIKELYARVLYATIQLRWADAARLANAMLFDARSLRASDFDLADVGMLLERSKMGGNRRAAQEGADSDAISPEAASDGVLVWVVRIVAFSISVSVGFVASKHLYISAKK